MKLARYMYFSLSLIQILRGLFPDRVDIYIFYAIDGSDLTGPGRRGKRASRFSSLGSTAGPRPHNCIIS